MPSGYKPSPLKYGSSTRNSPFRRRDSAASLRPTTPVSSPFKHSNHDSLPKPQPETTPSATDTVTPSSCTPQETPAHDDLPKPAKSPAQSTSQTRATPLPNTMASHGNALSQLQPSQVRTLRDGFQILDRDSDGVVSREDVADMLNQLGTPPSHPAQQPPSDTHFGHQDTN